MKFSTYSKFLLVAFFCFNSIISLRSQTETNDSLWNTWKNNSQPDSIRLVALENIAWEQYMFRIPDSAYILAEDGYQFAKDRGLKEFMAIFRNAQGVSFGVRHRYNESLAYFKEVLEISLDLKDSIQLSKAYRNLGTAYMRVSDHPNALDLFFKGLSIDEGLNDNTAITHVLINIGIIYNEINDSENARKYFEKGLEVTERSGNLTQRSYCFGNLGNVLKGEENYPEALTAYRACLNISENKKNAYSVPRALSSIGQIHLEMGQKDSAWVYFQKALPMSLELDDPEQLTILYSGMAKYERENGAFNKSEKLCSPIYLRVKEQGMLEEQSILCKCLYLSFKGQGKLSEALKFHEEWFQLTDSLNIIETSKKVQRLEFSKIKLADSLEQVRIVQTKDLELASQKADLRSQTIGLVASGGGLLLLGLLAFFIRRGKKRSDELLHNILPAEVASELKQKGSAQSKRIDQVTVLFTDFKGFTALSEKLSPKELVNDLNYCFSKFDHITAKFGIEKIKTIGDSYMAAGGLPSPNTTHAADVINAALEIRDFIESEKAKKTEQGLAFFEIRIGIHTGPVVAGIVGVKKFQYDIWGDTVNTASRMESSGKAGMINISQTTYEAVKDDTRFRFEYRGKIEAKGKGDLEMYFVTNGL